MAAKKIPEALKVKLETGDLTALRKALKKKNDKSYRDGEVWQAILNLGYSKWQKKTSRAWSYEDMVEWVGLEFGSFAKVCILMGKYNQQVTNGGHGQYWDNGYAGGTPGDPADGHPLHQDMLRLMKLIGIDRLELGKKTYDVMSRFKIVNLRDQSDYFDEYRDPEEGLGDDSVDDDYYKFCHEWMDVFGEVVRHIIMEEG